MDMNRFVAVTGCSGGGKSTLLTELAHRGYAVVEEPGRRIVEAELRDGGLALPWVDIDAFLTRAIAMAKADLDTARQEHGWVFFDRGLVDAAVVLASSTGTSVPESLRLSSYYYRRVFMVPPWPEIYVNDAARRHGLQSATAEYERLLDAYSSFGYEVTIVPKAGVRERADFVLCALANDVE